MTEFEPYTPKVVLAVGAHADDIDFTAAGSIAKWVAQGAHVHYLVITDGGKGSADSATNTEQLVATRQDEQRAAAKLLGAVDVYFLAYADGQLEITQALKKDIVRVIRQIRPDTVVTMDPTLVYAAEFNLINHPDHRAAGQTTLDAVYPLARDHMSFPELLQEEKLEPHKVAHMLLTNEEKQNYFVDITETFSKKIEAICAHVSQFPDKEAITQHVTQIATALGTKNGSQYAEGFMRIDTMP